MQHTQYNVGIGPGTGTQSFAVVVTACRAIYEHSWLLGDDAFYISITTARAYRVGDLEIIASNLSTLCAYMYENSTYNTWRPMRDLLYSLEQLLAN